MEKDRWIDRVKRRNGERERERRKGRKKEREKNKSVRENNRR